MPARTLLLHVDAVWKRFCRRPGAFCIDVCPDNGVDDRKRDEFEDPELDGYEVESQSSQVAHRLGK